MSSISMHMQIFVKIHQSLTKILSGNKNVMDGQTDRQPENSIPPILRLRGGYNKSASKTF